MTKVFVTLDIYPYRWKLTNGELWVIVQPHVAATELASWINASMTNDHEYVMASESRDPAFFQNQKLVPVNFPDTFDLALRLTGEGATKSPTPNVRRRAFTITAPDKFQLANVESGEANQTQPVAIPPGPFAAGYNTSLRDALHGTHPGQPEQAPTPVPSERLGQFLQLAFWGGTRRRLPLSCVNPDTVRMNHHMTLNGSTPDELITNLHSLNGLMFKLGGNSAEEILAYQKIELIQILVGSKLVSFDDSGGMDQARKAFTQYFTQLTAGLPEPLTEIKPTLFVNVPKRVYVREHQNTFVPQEELKLKNKVWFRRQAEDQVRSTHLDLSDLHRFIVRHTQRPVAPSAPSSSPSPTPAASPSPTPSVTPPATNSPTPAQMPPELSWTLYSSFEGRLVPYRKYHSEDAPPPKDQTPPPPALPKAGYVLQFLPAERDAARFYKEIAGDASLQLFTSKNPAYVDQEGKELLLERVGQYSFPWDNAPVAGVQDGSAQKTVLFYSAAEVKPQVTIIIPRTLKRPIKTNLTDDLWGARWEFSVPAGTHLESIEFDLLTCDDPPALLDLHPSLTFGKDVQFEFAQSVTNVEGLLDVEYPADAHRPTNNVPPPTEDERPPANSDVSHISPIADVREDLVNYSALKLYYSPKDPALSLIRINRFGQILPVGTTPLFAQKKIHRFEFRHRYPRRPSSTKESLAIDVPVFFRELYASVAGGQDRDLIINIEHTYGHRVTFCDPARVAEARLSELKHADEDCGSLPSSSLYTHLDFPPVLPTEVKLIPDAIEFNVPRETTIELEASGDQDKELKVEAGAWVAITSSSLGNGSRSATHIRVLRKLDQKAVANEPFQGIIENILPGDAGASTWRVRQRLSTDEEQIPFLTVTYDHDNGSETATLTFDRGFLVGSQNESEGQRAGRIAAWNSVAEMAFAEKILLKGRFLRFDFREALRRQGQVQIANGLKAVKGADEWQENLTVKLKSLSQQWLKTPAAVRPGKEVIPVPLSKIDDGDSLLKIFEACSVIEFHLELIRKAESVPKLAPLPTSKTSPWLLVRPLPARVEPGATGPMDPGNQQKTADVAPGDPVVDLFAPWIATLAQARSPIEPDLNHLTETAGLRRIVGDPHQPLTGNRDVPWKSWIFPGGEVKSDPDTVVPSICPLALKPTKKEKFLGDNTYVLLKKYFQALQAVLEGNVVAWRSHKAQEWRDHFNALHSVLRPIEDVLNRVAELLLPLPNPDSGNLDKEISESIQEYRRDKSNLNKAWREWLVGHLWNEPAVFGDSKAFLYTRLKSTNQTKLTRDFFQLISNKLICAPKLDRLSASPTDPCVESTLLPAIPPIGDGVDADRMTFVESFKSLSDSNWFGFGEILDDLRYDNEFQFLKFELNSLEEIVERLLESEKGVATSSPSQAPSPLNQRKTPIITIAENTLHLPEAVQKLPDTDRQPDLKDIVAPFVHLASRELLRSPTHLFTASLDVCQDRVELGQHLVPESEWLLSSFLKGHFIPASSQPQEAAIVVQAPSPLFDRKGMNLDVIILTSVFLIRGDEEIDTNHADAFANDLFDVDIARSVEQPPEGGKASEEPVAAIPIEYQPFFKEVAKTNVSLVPSDLIEKVIERGFLSSISKTLEAIEPKKRGAELGLVEIRIVQYSPPGIKADALLAACVAKESQAELEACVFRKRLQADTAGQLSRDYLLMVNVRVPVWEELSLGLIQSRNQTFAAEFAQVSDRVSDSMPDRPSASRDFRKSEKRPTIVLPNRNRRPLRDLINRLALTPGASDSTPWERYDLSVTVYHRQETSLHALFDPNQESTAYRLPNSYFPLQVRHFKAGPSGQPHPEWQAEVDWFLSDYDDFAMSFQWSSDKGRDFFRLDGIDVQFQTKQ